MKEFLKSGLLILKANLVTRLINLLSLGLLSRILGQQNFSLYNFYINTAGALGQIVELGICIPIQQKIAISKQKYKSELGDFLGSMLVLALFISVLYAFVLFFYKSSIFEFFLKSNYNKNYATIAIVIILIEYFNTLFTSLFFGFGLFPSLYKKNIFSSIIFLVLLIPSFFFIDLIYIFFSYAAYSALTLIYTIHLIKKELVTQNILLRLSNFFLHIENVFKKGFVYYLGNTLAGSILALVVILCFAKYLHVIEFSYFRIAYTFSGIINIVPGGLVSISLTYLARLQNSDLQLFKNFQYRFIIFGLFFSTLLVLVFLQPLISLFFGSVYKVRFFFISFLILLNFLTQTSNLLNNFLISSNKNNFAGVLSIVHVIIITTTLDLFVSSHGVNGYLLICLISQILILFIQICQELKSSNYSLHESKVLSFLIATAIGFFSCLFILYAFKNYMLIILLVVLIAFIYLILFLKYYLIEAERTFIISYLKNLKEFKIGFNKNA